MGTSVAQRGYSHDVEPWHSGLGGFSRSDRELESSDLDNGEALAANKGFWLLTALPALWFFAEVLTMLTNPKRRALHDFIAGTVVVRTNIQEESAPLEAAPNVGPAAQISDARVMEGPPSVS